MSFFDDNFDRLAGTDWQDADTGSNLQIIKATFGHREQTQPLTNNHLTRAERIARGLGSADDLAQLKEDNEKHKEWLASKEGKDWLEANGLSAAFGGGGSESHD